MKKSMFLNGKNNNKNMKKESENGYKKIYTKFIKYKID